MKRVKLVLAIVTAWAVSERARAGQQPAGGRAVISLDGLWSVGESVGGDEIPGTFARTVAVPGLTNQAPPPFADVDHYETHEYHWTLAYYGVLPKSEKTREFDDTRQKRKFFWYPRRFAAPARREHATLVVNKAQFGTAVWLNGRKVGEHAGCFTEGRFDVTAAMRWDQENRLVIRILPDQTPVSSARFVDLDQTTQGDWRGKYGGQGHEVVGAATSLPPDVQLDWSGADTWVWVKQTDDVRAPATDGAARVAACRYAGQLTLQVELPDKGRRLSLYYVDWDRRRTKQTFTVWSEDGTLLDRREVGNTHGGGYLTWEVQGCVQITVEQEGGPNAVISGVFLD